MNRKRRMEQRYGSADSMYVMVLLARLSLREAEQREAMWHARRHDESVDTRTRWVRNARSINHSIRIIYRRIRQLETKIRAKQAV